MAVLNLPQSRGRESAWRWTCLLALLATPAHANGAMGLALTIFDWRTWLIYVAATVLFEAWALGKLLQVPARKALGCSVGANLLTGLLGASCLGMFAYGSPWNRLNPNPFLHTLALFVVYGILSALIEVLLWGSATKLPLSGRQIVLRSVGVHLLGVPLGLAILLAPARPYRGLEMQVHYNRQLVFQSLSVRRALDHYLSRHHCLPPAKSYGEALEMLRPYLEEWAAREPDLWAAAYQPVYHRFDTGEARRGPMMEWNAQLAAQPDFLRHPPPAQWICRMTDESGYRTGFVWSGGEGSAIIRAWDPKALGYLTPPTAASGRSNGGPSGAK